VVLLQEIAYYMGLDLGKITIKRFADGEIYVQLQESVRGCDVFLVQPTCPPANENLMELLIMIDACRRASAKNITAVLPYFGYARADRKVSIILQHSVVHYLRGLYLGQTTTGRDDQGRLASRMLIATSQTNRLLTLFSR
jgi:ribose-phosphate pyrophosphokinase